MLRGRLLPLLPEHVRVLGFMAIVYFRAHHVLLLPYFLDHNLSPGKLAWYMGGNTMVQVLLGPFIERLAARGRQVRVIQAGALALSGSYLILLLPLSAWTLVLSCICNGVGYACIFGNHYVLAERCLRGVWLRRRADVMAHFEARIQLMFNICAGSAAMVGTLTYAWQPHSGIRVVLILQVVLLAVGAYVLRRLRSLESLQPTAGQQAQAARGADGDAWDIAVLVNVCTDLFPVILLQPLALEVGVSKVHLGYVNLGYMAVAVTGLWVAKRIAWSRYPGVILLPVFVLFAAVWMISWLPGYWALAGAAMVAASEFGAVAATAHLHTGDNPTGRDGAFWGSLIREGVAASLIYTWVVAIIIDDMGARNTAAWVLSIILTSFTLRSPLRRAWTKWRLRRQGS